MGAARYQWMRLDFVPEQRPSDWLPEEFAGLTPEGPAQAADVTWRLCGAAAGPGWFVVGDAGVLLDPASSHGVLRALLSGSTAGGLAVAVANGALDAHRAAATYQRWLHEGAERDIHNLAGMYARIGAQGFG
ncbi:NAD(P)/FAD-dependent oxidoreductase [Streptomyces sp. NPDC015130]|uniref:NAD(P)/FAD-dependent oxidoreductase n=1 Tax=Streptomyces sp. NPDC015130 TaxID=3364940 RepID=UPI003700D001